MVQGRKTFVVAEVRDSFGSQEFGRPRKPSEASLIYKTVLNSVLAKFHKYGRYRNQLSSFLVSLLRKRDFRVVEYVHVK